MDLDNFKKRIEEKLNIERNENNKEESNEKEVHPGMKDKANDVLNFLALKKEQYQPQIDGATKKISSLTKKAKTIVVNKIDNFKNKNKLD